MKYAFLKLTAPVALCAALLCGCGEKPVVIDINELAFELCSSDLFAEEMNNMSENLLRKRYGIEEGDYLEYKAGAGTRAVVDEYLIIKTDPANPDNAARVQSAIEKHINNQMDSYEDYRPDEMPKLEDYVYVSCGDYQIMVVSDNNAKAQEIITKYTQQ